MIRITCYRNGELSLMECWKDTPDARRAIAIMARIALRSSMKVYVKQY